MDQAPENRPPSPEIILDSLIGFQVAAVLKGAIDLELFTEIGKGRRTVAELAQACQASDKGIRVLCDFLTVRGFLTKSGQSYDLAPVSRAFLDQASPTYMGSIANFLGSHHLRQAFEDVAAVVRKGGTTMELTSLEPENPMWVTFARSMVPMMMLPASQMADILSQEPVAKILDVSASHGMFGILIALKHPAAKLVGLDWPNVLELTQESASRFDLADRFETIVGSVFDVNIGSGYDLILLPNFLHHFEPSVNVQLLAKMRAGLVEGGRVAIVEFVPNEDRVSPPFPAMFSMMMLGTTPRGDAYTEQELRAMVEEAGLVYESRHDLLPSPMTLLVGRRR